MGFLIDTPHPFIYYHFLSQPTIRYLFAASSFNMIISQEFHSSEWARRYAPCGLFISDFDGTLLRSDRGFSEKNLSALKQLGKIGVMRVIATGRTIYSFNTVPVPQLPVDFIIFSSGAGISEYPSGQIIRKVSLEPHEVRRAIEILKAAKLDFMVHRPIPENHIFGYFCFNPNNTDFDHRIALYNPFAFPLNDAADGFGSATQLLAILPPGNYKPILDRIRRKLSDFNIILTTSPLDGQSTWIEIFPANVSKSLTAAWLANEFGLDANNALSVGNDYNDLDLLEWASTSFVVENAPNDLKTRFPVVASNNDSGVAEAIKRWLAEKQF